MFFTRTRWAVVSLCVALIGIGSSTVDSGANPVSVSTNFIGPPTLIGGDNVGVLSNIPPVAGLQPTELNFFESVEATLPDDQVAAAAQSAFGSSYEGSWWLQNGVTPALVIGAINPSPAVEASLGKTLLAVDAGSSTPLLVQPVKYSSVSLSEYQSLATTDLQNAGIPFTEIAQLPQTDSLRITLPMSSSESAAVKALSSIPSDAYTLSSSGAIAQATSRTSLPPYQGGLVVADQTSPFSGNCTSGFTMVYSGGWYGSTAGHCAGDGDYVGIGRNGSLIGNAVGNTFDPRNPNRTVDTDFVMYGPASSHATTILTGVNGSTSLNVHTFASTVPFVGTIVCDSGISTQLASCGTVQSGLVSITLQYHNLWSGLQSFQTVQDEVETFTTIVSGDSGAGIYKNSGGGNIAAEGIANGNYYNNGFYVYGLFTPISIIDSECGCRPAYS